MPRRDGAVTLARALGGVVAWVALVMVPAAGYAQGTPLPLPADPGGARPPIFTEPPSTAPADGTPSAPAPSDPGPSVSEPSPTPTAPAPSSPAAGSPPSAAAPTVSKVPQVTSFPELTRGLGDSEKLLRD